MDKNTTSHILLVDDETAITENLAPFLERAGYKVATASNGEEAIRRRSGQGTVVTLRLPVGEVTKP